MISNKKIKTQPAEQNDNRRIVKDSARKQQQQQEEEQAVAAFDTVRSYLLHISNVHADVPVSHPAVQAALQGVDRAWKQHERDSQLRYTFAQHKARDDVQETERAVSTMKTEMMEKEDISKSNNHNSNNNNNNCNNNNNNNSHSALDDWQTIASPPSQEQEVITVDDDDDDDDNNNNNETSNNNDTSASLLGSRLAAHVIATLQHYDTVVASPLQALTVALHAALRSHTLGFVCTGQPESNTTTTTTSNTSSLAGGFAAPIRDLPRTQFLPKDWARSTTNTTHQDEEIIALRYRKPGVGSVVMQVAKSSANPFSTTSSSSSLSLYSNNNNNNTDAVVHITLTPWTTNSLSSTTEPLPGSPLVLALSDHVNLESFARARQSAQQKETTTSATSKNTILIPPALHYKALSKLLTLLVTNFDLGPLHEQDGNDQDTAMETTTTATATTSLATGSTRYVDVTSQRLPTAQQKVQTTFVPHPTAMATTGNRPTDPSEEPRPRPPDNVVFPERPEWEPAFLRGGNGGTGRGGDFGDDLYPGGIAGPPFGGSGPPSSFHPSGNLVGPGHPLFQQPNGHLGNRPPSSSWHDPGQSGNFLRPRFDPYGPPGGPTESPGFDHPNRNQGGAPPPPLPGGTGNPNDTSLPMPGFDNHLMPGFDNNNNVNNNRLGGGGSRRGPRSGPSYNMFM